MSLMPYVINSLVNICFTGTQNFSLMLALWGAMKGPLWRMTGVIAAFLAPISSSAEATPILWIPCQLVLEAAGLSCPPMASFVLFHLTGLVLLAYVLAVTLALISPEPQESSCLPVLLPAPKCCTAVPTCTGSEGLAQALELKPTAGQLAESGRSSGALSPFPQGGSRRVFSARTQRLATLPEAEEEEVRTIRGAPARG